MSPSTRLYPGASETKRLSQDFYVEVLPPAAARDTVSDEEAMTANLTATAHLQLGDTTT